VGPLFDEKRVRFVPPLDHERRLLLAREMRVLRLSLSLSLSLSISIRLSIRIRLV
jgi:hypothetical protein